MIFYDGQEELDNLVWDKNDEDTEKAQKQLRLTTFCQKVEDLVQDKFGKPTKHVCPIIVGGFNVLYRVRVEGMSPDVMLRVPCPSLVPFPGEKTIYEAATACLLADRTKLPVPRPTSYGEDSDLGSFIIMQHRDNNGSISARLTRPSEDPSSPHVLSPNVSDSTLYSIWGKVAHCLLQLSQLTFPKIGSLVETKEANYEVAGRPLSHNMADMVRLANIPRCILPPKYKTYVTTDEWYIALAEMHIAQLIFQHNDLITSEDDCRNKYVSRQLFRRLAKEGRLSTFGFSKDKWSHQSSKIPPETLSPAPSSLDSFRLWGDDFRAGNILLTESDEIAALIDWEFTYAAPTQFILDPPWWLLLETAEMWSPGLEDWKATYEQSHKASLPVPLSRYMRESWQTGRFFLSYAARKSWAFDAMYWNFLDERFFGDRDASVTKDDLWKTRIHLLSEEERDAMEPFVKRKIEEGRERKIMEWDEEEAKKMFSQLLFD
ncbi:hypothetical protein NW768_005968 [Fusarium equiseti]|uniref:Phosphotransferase n=1 Tax=Fusarium equiseti TaxID=61235 RepID=A0ABQ8RDD4_FUSEQ|nr:hypothetical protein NW768_005968 [Fusarium equiseti]